MLNSIAPEVVFHLAAKAQVPVALRDPRRAFDVNVMGTLNILEACRQLRVAKRVLIVSTDHVFGHVKESDLSTGQYRGGFDESSRVSYGGPYDTSKSAMELCVRSYHRTYWSQMPAIGITRAANVFGYGDVGPRRVIPLFVSSAVKSPHKISIKYRRNGRQFVYISDVINGYIRAAASLGEHGLHASPEAERPDQRSPFTPTFHFAVQDYEGTEEPFIRIKALGQLVVDQLENWNAKLVETDHCVDYAPNENPVQALKCGKTRATLGWRPHLELKDGIRKLGQWYAQKNDPRSLKRLLAEELDELLRSLQQCEQGSRM
jgi:CDP-glucose 4,6-dehydratase